MQRFVMAINGLKGGAELPSLSPSGAVPGGGPQNCDFSVNASDLF